VRRGFVVLAKVRGDVFARFHAVASKVTVKPGIHTLASWDRCFALPQVLYRWLHQFRIFRIPPLIKSDGAMCGFCEKELWLCGILVSLTSVIMPVVFRFVLLGLRVKLTPKL
jgi:hypothetical protein